MRSTSLRSALFARVTHTRADLAAHLAADSDADTELMSSSEEEKEEEEEEQVRTGAMASSKPAAEVYTCQPVIKLILGGAAKKIAACPPAAILDRPDLRYLRYAAFEDATGHVSELPVDEVLNTTIWELQRAAVSQLLQWNPTDPLLKLWRQLLPSATDIAEADPLYFRHGPADDRLLTHLFVGVKGGLLQWCTSGRQLQDMLRQLGAAAEERHDRAPEFVFCLRAPTAPRSTAAASTQEQLRPKPKPGRPAAQEKRVCFELAVGTKQVGQHGAPKFMRTSDAMKQIVVGWDEVPGHSVRTVESVSLFQILPGDGTD